MTRKEFIKDLGALAVAGCCLSTAALLEACGTASYVTYVEKEGMLTVQKESFGTKQFVLLNHPKLKGPVCLSRNETGKYIATLMVCTHLGCELNAAGSVLICPCHGSEFTFSGKVLSPPATEALPVFQVSENEQTVVVHLQP